ncbi:low affinity immunoglobulin epsilon Fc receptor-like isoform X1 [Cynoglossus semilaevis]|uniref:C-type lectin domain family 4 member E-like n=1 Tax=Cynoglossus semilaevis TaxID=244447 RepID=A0A3P8UEJ7_CYNSE|nr:low affinity immunoglobulin epsilon Fc receptor-like isoform X1 [Cynoglossus semilaevis]
MAHSEMISYEDDNTDGVPFHHLSPSKGAVHTFRVGSRSLPLYPVIIMCLGVLNVILLLTALILGIYCGEAGQKLAPQQPITQNSISIELKELQRIQSEAIKATHDFEEALKNELKNTEQLKLKLEQNKTNSDRFQRQLEDLHLEKATLQSTMSDDHESCGRCQPGWMLLNTTCYWSSKSASLPARSWANSKKDCTGRGGRLVVIDSWEEQVTLFDYMPVVSEGNWWNQGAWIGLTDQHAEDNWLWINNVTLGEGYWIVGEPNNWGSGEDCAVLLRTPDNNPRESWYDLACYQTMEWLCETPPRDQ